MNACGSGSIQLTCDLRHTNSSNELDRIVLNYFFFFFFFPSIRLISKPCNLILLLPGLYIIFVYKERTINKKITLTLSENESMWNMMPQYDHSKAAWRPDPPQTYWHGFSGEGLIWLGAWRHDNKTNRRSATPNRIKLPLRVDQEPRRRTTGCRPRLLLCGPPALPVRCTQVTDILCNACWDDRSHQPAAESSDRMQAPFAPVLIGGPLILNSEQQHNKWPFFMSHIRSLFFPPPQELKRSHHPQDRLHDRNINVCTFLTPSSLENTHMWIHLYGTMAGFPSWMHRGSFFSLCLHLSVINKQVHGRT